ncbi:MAG: Ig-like domain-containing protein [Thermodesulfobacteriota bacterium]|nr:Ig-like domain-containing protein [Thermodesulfobacteriota bacterium]
MIDFITKLTNTPLSTILVVAGIFFLFLAIGGQFAAKIITDRVQRKYAGVLGTILLLSGLTLYLLPGILTPSPEPSSLKINDLPRVISTTPQNEDQNVDPSLKKISVTFNRQMMDGSWSWVDEEKDKFPKITGKPYYTENNITNVLSVQLEANKEYVFWINTVNFKNFKDKDGNPATPYRFTFKTK